MTDGADDATDDGEPIVTDGADDATDDGEPTGDRRIPVGLSWRQVVVLVALGAVVVPGIVVGLLEAAGFSSVATVVWIVGYGTGVVVVWYVWIRPLDLVGAAEQDPSIDPDADADPERRDEEYDETDETPGSTTSTEST